MPNTLSLKYESPNFQLEKAERLSIGMGLRNGYLEIFELASEQTILRYNEICEHFKVRGIFCEHNQNQSTVWYYKNSAHEAPPEDITKNEFLYETVDNKILIYVRHREKAKRLAAELNGQFNASFKTL